MIHLAFHLWNTTFGQSIQLDLVASWIIVSLKVKFTFFLSDVVQGGQGTSAAKQPRASWEFFIFNNLIHTLELFLSNTLRDETVRSTRFFDNDIIFVILPLYTKAYNVFNIVKSMQVFLNFLYCSVPYETISNVSVMLCWNWKMFHLIVCKPLLTSLPDLIKYGKIRKRGSKGVTKISLPSD